MITGETDGDMPPIMVISSSCFSPLQCSHAAACTLELPTRKLSTFVSLKAVNSFKRLTS